MSTIKSRVPTGMKAFAEGTRISCLSGAATNLATEVYPRRVHVWLPGRYPWYAAAVGERHSYKVQMEGIKEVRCLRLAHEASTNPVSVFLNCTALRFRRQFRDSKTVKELVMRTKWENQTPPVSSTLLEGSS